MKRLFLFIALSILTSGVTFAQSAKELAKERKVLMKASKAELNQKATKAARKEAKKLKKEGWTTAPGALPLEKQLDKCQSNGSQTWMYIKIMEMGKAFEKLLVL